MAQDWLELTAITKNKPLVVERVRITGANIAIEGEFELPPLAKLVAEDQVFVAAFVANHGSIKEMERLFGVSYPTIKGRLNKISEKLDFIDVKSTPSTKEVHKEVLDKLERKEITAEEAMELLRK